MNVLVYVSGPMSLGDRAENVRHGVEAHDWLLDRGVAAICPHFSAHPQARPAEPGSEQYERMIASDLEQVRRCDAVLRLGGKSGGADRECAHARRHQIPVFEDRDACLHYCRGLSALRTYVERFGGGQPAEAATGPRVRSRTTPAPVPPRGIRHLGRVGAAGSPERG